MKTDFNGVIVIGLFVIIVSLLAVIAVAEDYSALNDEQFVNALQQDPATVFATDPARAWEALENNPFLLTNPSILEEAFALPNREQAMAFLDGHTDLLSDPNVIIEFEAAVQDDIALLNQNQQAAKTWLERKYHIQMENGATFSRYNVISLTTQGESATTFLINDFPGAIIHQDGSITYQQNTFKGADLLAVNRDNGYVQILGGEARITSTAHLEAANSVVYVGERGRLTSYRGSFILSHENGVVRASSREGQERFIYNSNMQVRGTIIHPPNTLPGEFIIEGSAVLNRVKPTGERNGQLEFSQPQNTLRIESTSQVYFSQQGERGEATFCRTGFTCIIDASATLDVQQRTRFAIIGMTNNDRITLTTPAYYEHVEVINAHSGQATINSVSPTNIPLGSITVGPRDDIRAHGNSLEHINFGRIDVVYPENPSCTGESCRQTLHHWSSATQQNVAGYFLAARREDLGRDAPNAMVRCTLGVDCEERIARNFGKVIGPPGRIPATTIIIGGDTSAVARSLEPWCQSNGCYIINSRDALPTTTSTNLVVTGHHFGDHDYVWRESVNRQGQAHMPVDFLYVGAVADGSGSPFDHLPIGENVESITFSSCNSAKENEFTLLDAARQTYPELKQLQGWSGTAPPGDAIQQPRISIENVQNHQAGTISGRTWYFRDGERWLWTRNGKTCTIVTGGSGNIECPGSTTLAQR
ncbi:hypothetical protein HYU22_00935 [Candidatus Woesearchaeota archaeon]|nr:hypothetical protein [Candidatus Woesearchaeota archaeon]